MHILFLDKKLESFITSCDKPTIAKIARSIDLLEEFGHTLGLPHTKKIETNLFELRIRGQQEVRIFYTFKNKTIMLLSGFIKKTQKTPRKEIERAKKALGRIDTI